MAFNADAVADLLGVEDGNATDRPESKRELEGVSSSPAADIQPSEPSLRTRHIPSVWAGGLSKLAKG